jgi:heme-degrading monooxygenase HmoA
VRGRLVIARIWRGFTAEAKAEAYLNYMRETGVRDLQLTDGNRGVYVLRRIQNGRAEFILISLWESIDAIRKFAGSDVEKAVYYPEDSKFLQALEPNVAHYEVLVKP